MLIENYQPPKTLLNNRIILVTGASDGIGRVAATTFAQYGATVILVGRKQKKLETLYDEIETAGYPQPAIYPMDFETMVLEKYTGLAESITNEFGRLDGLLHNAGMLGQITPIEGYHINTWYQVFQVNVHAAFILTQVLLPELKKSDNGSILFTSSNVGRKGRAYWGAYGISKFAIEGLMQTLADELEGTTTIRVNSIDPGAVNTNMRRQAFPGEPANSNPTPEQIMKTYLYLMGADSNNITGQALHAQKPSTN